MGELLLNNHIKNKEMIGLRLLENIVNIDSPSRDRQAVNDVGEEICRFLKDYDVDFEIIPNKDKKYGDFILATINPQHEHKVVLLGHRDTVFPKGTANDRPFSVKGNYAYGPGVSDMKSGIVSSILALLALKQSNLNLGKVELLITPDEEIGSPSSRQVIEERTKDALAVFNLEPGRPDGSVVTARRGAAHVAFEIKGVAAHSGTSIEEGVSAIEELGHKIIALQQLTDLERGMTVNVGLVEGGENTNMVAPHASGYVHFGFQTIEDFETLYEKAKEIFKKSYVEGTTAKLHESISFLPMQKNKAVQKLYDIVEKNAHSLKIPIKDQQTKGASDAGFPASLGVPTICAMGPIGGHWHNDAEYMELDTFIPRTQLLTQSIVSVFKEF